MVPQSESPGVVDRRRRQNSQAGGQSDCDGIREELGPHGSGFRLAPACEVRLVNYQRGGVPHAFKEELIAVFEALRNVIHTCVDAGDEKEAPAVISERRSLIQMMQADTTLRVDHAEDEQAEDGGNHDEGLGPEEFAQLVGTEERQRQIDEPEQEEREESGAGDAHRCGNSIWDVRVVVPEDGAQHVRYER